MTVLDRDFERRINQHKDAVYRQMVRMCGNHEDAEDVLVETLVKAYRAQDQLEDDAAFRGWLAIIARRTCGRLKRREATFPLLRLTDLSDEGFEPSSDTPSPEQQAIEAETRACIQSVVSSLPPLYREVYEMRDVDGLSANEVAERLDISIAAVKSRLHRARILVRKGVDAGIGTSS